VLARLGVTESSIWNWEAGHTQPDLRCMPAIITFLGYNPLPETMTLAERLVQHRRMLGISRKEAAAELGVDHGPLAQWERADGSTHGCGAPIPLWW
jgi:transcriptional regulator with XRE-family HTH domain